MFDLDFLYTDNNNYNFFDEIMRQFNLIKLKLTIARNELAHISKPQEIVFFKTKTIHFVQGKKVTYTYSYPYLRFIDKNGYFCTKYLKKKEYNRVRLEAERYQYLSITCNVLEDAMCKIEKMLQRAFYFHPSDTPLAVIDSQPDMNDQVSITREHNSLVLKERAVYKPEHYNCIDESGLVYASRGELLLSNILKKCGVPAKYEERVFLENTWSVLYPDFTVKLFNKHYIIELFGMMDNPEYSSRTYEKLRIYAKNGYILGKNLIGFCSFGKSNINLRPMCEVLRHLVATGEVPPNLVWLEPGQSPPLPSDIQELVNLELSKNSKKIFRLKSKVSI